VRGWWNASEACSVGQMKRSVLLGVVVAELLAGFFPAAAQADLYTVFDRG